MRIRLNWLPTFTGMIHAFLVIIPVCAGVFGQIQPIFWMQALLSDFGGVLLVYSLLVTVATFLVFLVGGSGKLDLLCSLVGLLLLARAHGVVALDAVDTKQKTKSKAQSDVSVLVITKRFPPAWNERVQPLVKSSDVVVALDDAGFIIPAQETFATREQVTVGNKSFVLVSKLPTAVPSMSEFGVPSGAALIATLSHPVKGPFQIGILNLAPIRDPESFSLARVTTRRVATQFRHSDLPALLVGDFNSTIFGQPCRIFSKLGGLSHEVAPGLPTVFQVPLRPCVDPTNIIARGWNVEFLPTGAPGVMYARLYRL